MTYAMLAGAWLLFALMIVVALNSRRRSRRIAAEQCQWTVEEVERLRAMKRPPITYNRIKDR